VRRLSAFLIGLAAGLALVGLLRRRRKFGTRAGEEATADLRAEELRRKLAESREVVGEAGPAGTGTEAEPLPEHAGGEEVDRARRAVHREAQDALDEMRQAGL
jgi:hypothetical protein